MRRKKAKKKCITANCENTSDLGTFVGDLCAPCHVFITSGNGRDSQAYRNSLRIVSSELIKMLVNGLVIACDPTKRITT